MYLQKSYRYSLSPGQYCIFHNYGFTIFSLVIVAQVQVIAHAHYPQKPRFSSPAFNYYAQCARRGGGRRRLGLGTRLVSRAMLRMWRNGAANFNKHHYIAWFHESSNCCQCHYTPYGLVVSYKESRNNKPMYGYILPNLSRSPDLYRVQSVYKNNVVS